MVAQTQRLEIFYILSVDRTMPLTLTIPDPVAIDFVEGNLWKSVLDLCGAVKGEKLLNGLFLAFNFDEEVPEYDMDSEDEEWLRNFNKKKVRFLP